MDNVHMTLKTEICIENDTKIYRYWFRMYII